MVGVVGSEPFYCFFDLLKADADKMSAIPLGPKGYIPSSVKPIGGEMALITANNINDSKLLLWSETLNSVVGVTPLNAVIIEKIEVEKDSPRFYLIAKNQSAELDFLSFTLNLSHSQLPPAPQKDLRSFTESNLAKMLPVKVATISYGESYPGSSDAVFFKDEMVFFTKTSGSINYYKISGERVKPRKFDLMTKSGSRGHLVAANIDDSSLVLAESIFPSDSDEGYKYSYINLINISTVK